MLGAHPDITLFNEPMLIKDMREWGFGFDDCIEGQKKAELLEKLRKRHHVAAMYEKLAITFAGNNKPESFKEVYEKLLPVPEGNMIWGEKTPSNLLYVEELFRLYPESLFIHITREPGAVLLSHYYKKIATSKSLPVVKSKKNLLFISQHSIRWAILMRIPQLAENKLGALNFVRIKYEDLLMFPEIVMKNLCEKIGIQYDSSLLDEKSRQASSILPSGTEYAHALLDKPLEVSRSRAGKNIPSWMRYIINKYAGEMLKRLGYEFDQVKPSMAEVLMIECILYMKERKFRRTIKDQLKYWGVVVKDP